MNTSDRLLCVCCKPRSERDRWPVDCANAQCYFRFSVVVKVLV